MKNGDIVEQGQTHDVFNNPQHPYTQRLVNATPRPKWEDDPENHKESEPSL